MLVVKLMEAAAPGGPLHRAGLHGRLGEQRHAHRMQRMHTCRVGTLVGLCRDRPCRFVA
jgi:hypothetical protein